MEWHHQSPLVYCSLCVRVIFEFLLYMDHLFIATFTIQFYDGVVLIILMGLLDNYFIPLSEYYSSPVGFDQQVSTKAIFL